jgi:hypothetical protein
MHILSDGAELFTPQSPSLENPFGQASTGSCGCYFAALINSPSSCTSARLASLTTT